MATPNKAYGGNILEAFLPTAQTKSSRTTSKTTGNDVSAEGINELIRGMMEGDSGLANILTGQQSRGLYNSTTAKLLADDLAARVAGKAAVAGAKTTETETVNSKTQDPNGKPDKKSSAIMEILGQVLNSGAGQKFTSEAFGALGSGLKSLFGMEDGGSKKSAPVQYDTLQMNPNAGGSYGAYTPSGNSFDSGAGAGDYMSTSIFGGKNNFGQDDDEFSQNFVSGGGYDFSAGLGMDGFDFSPFTLGSFNPVQSTGSSYKSANSYDSGSFSGGTGVQFSGGSGGSSGISVGFSF